MWNSAQKQYICDIKKALLQYRQNYLGKGALHYGRKNAYTF